MIDLYSSLNICSEWSEGSLHWQVDVFLFVNIMNISFLMLKVILTARKELLEKKKKVMEEWLKAMFCYRITWRKRVKAFTRGCLFRCSSSYHWWCCIATAMHGISPTQLWDKRWAMSNSHQRAELLRNRGCDRNVFLLIFKLSLKG